MLWHRLLEKRRWTNWMIEMQLVLVTLCINYMFSCIFAAWANNEETICSVFGALCILSFILLLVCCALAERGVI